MRRCAGLTVLLLLVLYTQVGQAEASVQRAYVNASVANVRKASESTAELVAKPKDGSDVRYELYYAFGVRCAQ